MVQNSLSIMTPSHVSLYINKKKNYLKMNPTEITYIKNSKNSNNITKNFPKWEIEGGDGFQSVKFTLKPGQDIYADGGKMNYMSDNIEIRTETTGLFGGIMKMVSRSSFFYNIFFNPSDTPRLI